MITRDVEANGVVDFSALDEELFGDTPDDEYDNEQTLRSLETNTTNITYSLNFHHDAGTAGSPKTSYQIVPQVKATSRSSRYTPPASLPTTPQPSSENHQHRAGGPLNHAPSDPEPVPSIASATSSNSDQLVAGNISWMKSRITDVHQLLLHYLNLRDAHQSLATEFQKETVLRAETQETLESIREQQDQASEDFPKLQFQIAQLKLDYQKERTARTVAEASLANINEEAKAYKAGYVVTQARVSDHEVKEKEWQKEVVELTAVKRTLLQRSGGRIQPQKSSPEENSSPQTPTETARREIQLTLTQLAEQSDILREKDREIERLNSKLNELATLYGFKNGFSETAND